MTCVTRFAFWKVGWVRGIGPRYIIGGFRWGDPFILIVLKVTVGVIAVILRGFIVIEIVVEILRFCL